MKLKITWKQPIKKLAYIGMLCKHCINQSKHAVIIEAFLVCSKWNVEKEKTIHLIIIIFYIYDVNIDNAVGIS